MENRDLEWAKSLIKPGLPDYDNKDHEIAKLRFILNEIVEEFDEIRFLTSDIMHKENDLSWFEKKKRQFTNWYWRFTGKRSFKLLGYDPTLEVSEISKKIERVLYRSNGECRIPDGTNLSDIDRYADERDWDRYRSYHTDAFHCGDCTAVPASCMKCHAEQFYGFETPYEGKAKGSKALNIYLKHMKENENEIV